MRGLPARCIASCALCAALLVAVAGPTAAASRGPVPVPHADALRPQVEAVTSGEATQVESTLPAVVSGLVDAVAATMLDTELPAPDLAGLSSLPSSSQLPTS